MSQAPTMRTFSFILIKTIRNVIDVDIKTIFNLNLEFTYLASHADTCENVFLYLNFNNV